MSVLDVQDAWAVWTLRCVIQALIVMIVMKSSQKKMTNWMVQADPILRSAGTPHPNEQFIEQLKLAHVSTPASRKIFSIECHNALCLPNDTHTACDSIESVVNQV